MPFVILRLCVFVLQPVFKVSNLGLQSHKIETLPTMLWGIKTGNMKICLKLFV